jgi:hypothetical protein
VDGGGGVRIAARCGLAIGFLVLKLVGAVYLI